MTERLAPAPDLTSCPSRTTTRSSPSPRGRSGRGCTSTPAGTRPGGSGSGPCRCQSRRTFSVAELTAPLRLLDVASDWATRAGAGAHLSTGPRRLTSDWARAIATRWPELHGVAYSASTRPAGRAVALWSPRCRDQVETSRLLLLRTLDDPVLYGALAWAAHITGTALLRKLAP